ncbi:MAG: hypothetical protein ACRDON_06750 [Gaiellaceae bacterium]
MNEQELGRALLTVPVPGELDAQRRAWAVVRAAYAEREPGRRQLRRLRPLLAFAIVLGLVGAAVSPPGQAVGDWIQERIEGENPAEPALFRLPAPGRLLVVGDRGPWVVRGDGSSRFLGRYENASWSPNGLFVVVTQAHRVLAVEPNGDFRWKVARPERVSQARWSTGDGFRVAYRAGETLRVVDGDGENDRLLTRGVAPVAVAWRPQRADEHVLAYADARDRVHVVDVDTRRALWPAQPVQKVRRLLWSADGQRLLAVREHRLDLFRSGGHLAQAVKPAEGHVVLDAAFAPRGRGWAYTDYDPAANQGKVAMSSGRTLFAGTGRLEELAWSPSGRWLLVGWPDADQWLFLRLSRAEVGKVVAVEGISREFNPGGDGGVRFPRVAGWCCAP